MTMGPKTPPPGSPTAAEGEFRLVKLFMLVWLPAGLALVAFVLAYAATYYGGQVSHSAPSERELPHSNFVAFAPEFAPFRVFRD